MPEAESVTLSGTLVDMHTHTVLGAYDSGLQPERLLTDARGMGLGGVTVTEHDRMWDAHTLRRYRDEHSTLVVANGMEVSTDMGHILAYGLTGYTSGIHELARLRQAADERGGYLVVAHPFRYWFEPVHFTRRGLTPPEMVPEALAKLPVFEYVDAIEVYNGANSERENLIALEVAQWLGKPGMAGSDCHSAQGIGCACTLFERELESAELMLQEMRAGRFAPMRNHASGELRTFTLGETAESPLAPPIPE
jgi:predicted metal-dependent phosphoesterase TrpH